MFIVNIIKKLIAKRCNHVTKTSVIVIILTFLYILLYQKEIIEYCKVFLFSCILLTQTHCKVAIIRLFSLTYQEGNPNIYNILYNYIRNCPPRVELPPLLLPSPFDNEHKNCSTTLFNQNISLSTRRVIC